MRKVLLVEPIHQSGRDILVKAGLDIVVSPSTETGALVEAMDPSVFAIIVRTSQLEAPVIEAGSGLRLISRHGIGVNNIDLAAAGRRDVVVANVPDANAYAVAEYVIAAIMMLTRKLVLGDACLRAGKMSEKGASLPGLVRKHGVGGNELPGRCLGIIGLGNIGGRVADMASNFLGMKVLAYDPYRSTAPMGIRLVSSVAEILAKADFVSLHTPLTPDTDGLIDAAALSAMKPSAYLINAGRGGLVDEGALAVALGRGDIAGAVLDVFHEEPPDLSSPLFKAPNLVLTPHVAGATAEAVERLAQASALAVVDMAQGRKPASVVNPDVWERVVRLQVRAD